nr:receptor-like protein EIX2 [Ziziphus jujuba var. spinosa]
MLTSWTSGEEEDCCMWRGIKCDNKSNHVVVLNLAGYYREYDHQRSDYKISRYFDEYDSIVVFSMGPPNFGGEIGSSLVELKYLRHLDLSLNNFTRIPNFIGSLARLRYLNLRWNPISGPIPSQLGNLTRLRFLDLYSEGLMTAEDLEWLPRLSSLTTLTLGRLNLSKPVDWLQSIKITPSLSSLQLWECHFPYKVNVGSSSLSHINSSNSLTTLKVVDSTIDPIAVPWLLNVSGNLVNLDIRASKIRVPLPNSFDNMRSLENINWTSNNIEGGIPKKSMGNLCNLKSLDLSDNSLNGKIIDLLESLVGCARKSLEILNLQYNKLGDSLLDLSRFSSLKELYLANNDLNGSIMENIGQLSNLEILDVSSNYITGMVSKLNGTTPDLLQFSSLKELYLANNKLNGSLMESIGQLSNLEVLDVSSNYITGVVSKTQLQKLSKLKKLDLSLNSLIIDIESEWVPPFQLSVLKLGSCRLGASFPSWLQTQSELFRLDISNSGISDYIPDWFSNLTPKLRYLNLSCNSIKGILPNFPLKFDIYPIIDLSSNQFHGSIPTSLDNATALFLSNNTFTNLKPFLCAEQSYRPTALLDLSNNMLSGSLPDCWMHWSELIVLNLENNKLSGNIPSSMGSLYQISTLRLSNNDISGILPSSLKNCTGLQLLDVGQNNLNGEIPTWIGEYLTRLVVLRLKSNRFYGSLPLNLCQLSDIQILDVSLNDLSGFIPRCFHTFTRMVHKVNDYVSSSVSTGIDSLYTIDPSRGYGRIFVNYEYITWKGKNYKYDKNLWLLRIIDLSSNKLTGEIPINLTNLVVLVQLNLSRNNLSGTIPESIGKMKLLESLDLSHNQLSGKIPMGLADLSFLAFLDLSNNQLWGRIPTGTQLQTFEASVYSENRGLCGPPLNLYVLLCT